MHDRDVNLPTQRQLLAQYRCAEITKVGLAPPPYGPTQENSLSCFARTSSPALRQISHSKRWRPSARLWPRCGRCCSRATSSMIWAHKCGTPALLPSVCGVANGSGTSPAPADGAALPPTYNPTVLPAHFDEVGRSYDATVYEAMRLELVSAVHSELYGLYVNQLHNLEDAAQRVCVSMLDVRCVFDSGREGGRAGAGADKRWRVTIGVRDNPTGQAQGRPRADGRRCQVGQDGGARCVPGGGAHLDLGRDNVAVPGDSVCAREGA